MGIDFSTVAPVIGGAIGSYWGFAGQMIGSALMGMLFKPEETNQVSYYDYQHKESSTIIKPDVLPVVFGTDVAPAQIIWLDPNDFGMVEHQKYGNECLNNWADGFQIDFQMFNANFIAAFGDSGLRAAYRQSYQTISTVWLNDLHFWLYFRFQDMIQARCLYGGPVVEFNKMYWYFDLCIDPRIEEIAAEKWTPIWLTHIFLWKGPIDVPFSQSLVVSMFWNLEDKAEPGLQDFAIATGVPKIFPSIKVETSQELASHAMTPFGGRSEISSSFNISYKDNKSDYLYGIISNSYIDGFPPPFEAPMNILLCKLNIYTNSYEYLLGDTKLEAAQNAYYNYFQTYHDSQQIYRQDIDGNPDHLYIMRGRNWSNGGTLEHHHAPYALEFDLFYIDRSDDSVHSVAYKKQFSVVGVDGESNSRPRITIHCMEICGDHILVIWK